MGSPSSERPWPDRRLWEIRPIRDLLWIGVFILLIWVVYTLRAIFAPAVVAMGLAYLSMPVIRWAGRRLHLAPPVTIALIIFFSLLALAGLGFWLWPIVRSQIFSLIKQAPAVLERLSQHAGSKWEASSLSAMSSKMAESLKDRPLAVLGPLWNESEKTLTFIESTIGATAYFVITAGLLPIYYWGFALRFDDIMRYLLRYVPASRRERTVAVVSKMDRAAGSYIRGRVIVSAIMGVGFAIGWSPLFTDVPYWLLAAILTGLLSLIPYGAGLGWLIALLLKAAAISSGPEAGTWTWVVGLGGPTIVFAIIQGAEHFFMTPWVQSRSTNLSLITVVLSIMVGGAVAGILGMLIAIPLAACGKILLEETVLRRWEIDAAGH